MRSVALTMQNPSTRVFVCIIASLVWIQWHEATASNAVFLARSAPLPHVCRYQSKAKEEAKEYYFVVIRVY